MPLPITQKLASFQQGSRTSTGFLDSGLGPSAGGALHMQGATSAGPLAQSIDRDVTRANASATFTDPNFWRARSLNRMGTQTHTDPAVQAYLNQFQQTTPAKPGMQVLGTIAGLGVVSKALQGIL